MILGSQKGVSGLLIGSLGLSVTVGLEDVLESPQRYEDEGDQDESSEDRKVALMAHQEPSKVAQPGEGPLHLPALSIARAGLCYGTPSFGTLAFAPLVVRDGRFDPSAP